jgi:hypothetical protein
VEENRHSGVVWEPRIGLILAGSGRRHRAARPPASSRDVCGLGKGQTAQVVRSLGCLAARCKECPFIGFQKLNPIGDVPRVPNVTVKAKFCTQEGGT